MQKVRSDNFKAAKIIQDDGHLVNLWWSEPKILKNYEQGVKWFPTYF